MLWHQSPKSLAISRSGRSCLSETMPAQGQILCPWELGSIPGAWARWWEGERAGWRLGQGSAKVSWSQDEEWAQPAESSARGWQPGSRANSGAPHRELEMGAWGSLQAVNKYFPKGCLEQRSLRELPVAAGPVECWVGGGSRHLLAVKKECPAGVGSQTAEPGGWDRASGLGPRLQGPELPLWEA